MSTSECCENPPWLSPSCGEGSIENIGGLNTYVTRPNSNSKRAILLISDVFGYEAPNLRKLADKVAASGFLVLVPDFLNGDYLKLDPDFDRQAWLKKHGTDQGCEDAKMLITALRGRGVTSIGAAGFCWGGVVVVKLAKSADYIKAGVVLHPGPLTDDDINEVKIPISILGAEIDHTCPPEQARHFEKILAAKSEGFIHSIPRAPQFMVAFNAPRLRALLRYILVFPMDGVSDMTRKMILLLKVLKSLIQIC